MSDSVVKRNNDYKFRQTQARKDRLLTLVMDGKSIGEALEDDKVGVTYSAYRKWRERDAHFASKVDVARGMADAQMPSSSMSSAAFALRYFGRKRAHFQQLWIDTFKEMPLGDILLCLWPPETGKTTTAEDYFTEAIARDPGYRIIVAGESADVPRRIIGRVRNRFEPAGPYPLLIKEWGPFKPDVGQGSSSTFNQPWNNNAFAVFRNRGSDEREPNMLALSRKSSILSTRTDHLHIDDVQSTKTLKQTPELLTWLRQDAFSRPGEYGKTSMNGSRVGDGDVYEEMMNDAELAPMLHVVMFKAQMFNQVTGEWESLWPERYTMESWGRIKGKVGVEAWDRNYMMAPGASKTNRTFSDAGIARSTDATRKLNDPAWHIDASNTVYLCLDPGLDSGINCIQAWAVTNDKMYLAYFSERQGLERNEDIVQELEKACKFLAANNWRVSDLVIESMNFQRGLARDERIKDLRDRYGFQMREHLTGLNKYDENIGLASMAGSFEAGNINLPYDLTDSNTKIEMDEFIRQMKAWKPGQRGTKLRQDRLMAMWFGWILWQQRRKTLTKETKSWQRGGLPYAQTKHGLLVPIGARI